MRKIPDEQELETVLSEPYPEDLDVARRLNGDVIILGAGGKMGPTLARRIHRALRKAGSDAKVKAVSRFSDRSVRERLKSWGVETIRADLMDGSDLRDLPDCANVIYMIGKKFGASEQKPGTWAINAYLPGRVAERFRSSRFVVFSTGNVYPPVPVSSGGSSESDSTGPVGEYAQSCLGRERVFQYFSREHGTPVCLIRLNYAVELRYGVLYDIARFVYEGKPVPLDMGYVNMIWQGDANSIAFRCLEWTDAPAEILNVTGPKIHSVRDLAEQFADRFDRKVTFRGEERETALLNDAGRCHERFGLPEVGVEELIDPVADWIERGKPALDKPTKFYVRSGEF